MWTGSAMVQEMVHEMGQATGRAMVQLKDLVTVREMGQVWVQESFRHWAMG